MPNNNKQGTGIYLVAKNENIFKNVKMYTENIRNRGIKAKNKQFQYFIVCYIPCIKVNLLFMYKPTDAHR
jgi:hypothetical protein